MGRGRPKSKGLGDTVEKITKATGIHAVVKFIAGEDCGCEERKDKLNKIFPYKKVSCLNENDFNYLQEFFKEKINELIPSQQRELIGIYFRIFGTQLEPTQCPECWRRIINEIKTIYDEYKNDNSGNADNLSLSKDEDRSAEQ